MTDRTEIIRMAEQMATQQPESFEAKLQRRMVEGLAEAARRGITIPATFPDLMATSARKMAEQEGADPERAVIFARNLAVALTTPEPEPTTETTPEQSSVWDWAVQPTTYTGHTRILEYTRDRDGAASRPCQPGDVAQRLLHQREYQQGAVRGWETTHEVDVALRPSVPYEAVRAAERLLRTQPGARQTHLARVLAALPPRPTPRQA